MCSSCGPAQGVNHEHLALYEHIEELLDAHQDDASEKIADLVIETRNEERKRCQRGIENLLKHMMRDQDKAVTLAQYAISEDYDEELDTWIDSHRILKRKKQ